jgi:hypothetical protein
MAIISMQAADLLSKPAGSESDVQHARVAYLLLMMDKYQILGGLFISATLVPLVKWGCQMA